MNRTVIKYGSECERYEEHMMGAQHSTPNHSPSPMQSQQKSQPQHSAQTVSAQTLSYANIRGFSPETVMHLQRTIGNQAVLRLLNASSESSVIQRNPVTDRLKGYMNDDQEIPVTRLMAQHLLNIMSNISGGQWQTAYDLLTNKAIANLMDGAKIKIVKFSVFDRKRFDTEVFRAMKAGQYNPVDNVVTLPDIEVAYMDEMDLSSGLDTTKTPANDTELAQTFLPVMLEEWIHMFQYRIGGYLSHATESFARNKAAEITQNNWNLKEVDIYAIYRDLKWFVVLDAFRARYAERQKFEEFSPTWKPGRLR